MKTRPGWITFPILPPNSDGSCGCGDIKCRNAGKHPRPKSLPLGESVPVAEGFNEGVATGARSGIIIFDLHRKNGVNGLTALRAMGDVPETLTNATPTSGFQLIYNHPGKGIWMPNSSSAIA